MIPKTTKFQTFIALIALLVCSIPLCAQSSASPEELGKNKFYEHEVRVGWGDQIFETLVWHDPVTKTIIPENPFIRPGDFRSVTKENYSYSQHFFAEYQYYLIHWFSVGGMLDMSGFSWNLVTRDGTGKVLDKSGREYCYNIVMMPTIRFTYFRHNIVQLYSGLGVGLDINGGTETNIKGKRTDAGLALNLTLLGMSANYKRIFAAVEYGGMYALHDMNSLFMVKSRMLTASVGFRF